MTQLSQPWTCVAVGDGSPYDLEIVEARSRLLGNVNPSRDGVIYWNSATVFPDMTNPTNEFLQPEFVSGNTVRINPGIGMVQGWIYFNDADVDFNVAGGNANAIDIIGLRRDLAGQTVRLFHGRGAAGSLYNLVQTTATWEIPLMEVALNGAGNYSALADRRTLVKSPMSDRILLSERIITAAEEAALTPAVTVTFPTTSTPLFKDLVVECRLRSQGASFSAVASIGILGHSGNIYGGYSAGGNDVEFGGDTGLGTLPVSVTANGTDNWSTFFGRHTLLFPDINFVGSRRWFEYHSLITGNLPGRRLTKQDFYGVKATSTATPTGVSFTTTGTTWLAGSAFRLYGVH